MTGRSPGTGCCSPPAAQPRHLAAVDESGAEVTYLRTLEDSLALKERLGGTLLVIGAGWIGLEVASAARNAGGERHRRRDRAAAAAAGAGAARSRPRSPSLHREHDVDLRLGTGLDSISARRRPHHRPALRRPRGAPRPRAWSASAPAPDDALAAAAGLATDNGVLVDAGLRAGAADVWAAGDVANHDHPTLGPGPGRALGQRDPPGQARRPRDARRRRGVRPAALLLHRPVRPRHGVRRPRRAGRLRRGRGAGRPGRRRGSSRRCGSGRPGRGRDARQRLGRHRRAARGGRAPRPPTGSATRRSRCRT